MTARRSSNPAALSNLSFQLPDLLALTSSFPFRVNKNCKFASDASEEWLLSLSSAPPSVSPSSETFSRQGAGYTGIDSLLSVSEKESLLGSKYGLLASLCSPTSDAPQLRILADFLALVWTSHIRILHGSRPSSRSTSNDSRPDGNPTWDQARGWAGAGAVHGHGWSAGSGWMSSMHVDSVEDGMELLEMNSLLKSVVPSLKRASSRLSPSHFTRWNTQFTHSTKSFAKAQLKVYENLRNGSVPTLPEYIALRREMYGISMFMDLLDLLEISQRPFTYGNGNRAKNLKDRLEREEESVRRMESLTIDIVGWILDIFSYASGTTGLTRCKSHNLITLLTTHKNLSVQGAMNYAGGMVREALEEVQRLDRELHPPPTAIGATSHSSAGGEGGWGWLNMVRSVVGLSESQGPRPNWKFLTPDIIPGPAANSPEADPDSALSSAAELTPDAVTQHRADIAHYARALIDMIVGTIHWGYETELYFGQKGDEVRSFGWVFLAHNDHTTMVRD